MDLQKNKWLTQEIRVDNGSEFISSKLENWAHSRQVKPGKPAKNEYIERFNRAFREDIWIREYNNERSHDTLGGAPS